METSTGSVAQVYYFSDGNAIAKFVFPDQVAFDNSDNIYVGVSSYNSGI